MINQLSVFARRANLLATNDLCARQTVRETTSVVGYRILDPCHKDCHTSVLADWQITFSMTYGRYHWQDDFHDGDVDAAMIIATRPITAKSDQLHNISAAPSCTTGR